MPSSLRLFENLSIRTGVPALNDIGSRTQVSDAIGRLYHGLDVPDLELPPDEDVVAFLTRTAKRVNERLGEHPFQLEGRQPIGDALGHVHYRPAAGSEPEYMQARRLADGEIRVWASAGESPYFTLVREKDLWLPGVNDTVTVTDTLCSDGRLKRQVLKQEARIVGRSGSSQRVMTACDGKKFAELPGDNPFVAFQRMAER